MRDLASRLRAIVRENPAEKRSPVPFSGAPAIAVPSEKGTGDLFSVTDHLFDADHAHGRALVADYAVPVDGPVGLFDLRLQGLPDWASRVVFFDIETTGLAGGAGTIAFLVGCGWFEDGAFRVRQFFLAGPAGEPALLDALAEIVRGASLLVTFNGRTFDVPTMEMRWAFHRRESPFEGVPHFDMLPIARRLWKTADAPCSLTALERSVLGFHRRGDIPGFEIPARYFQFLRTGDLSLVTAVLEHNRHDILSLAAVAARALRMAADGPDAAASGGERLALGRLYERAGDGDRARRAYELASTCETREVRGLALARLAILLRRDGRHDEAARAWQGVLEQVDGDDVLERQAAEALAIHHEHRARDFEAARRYAEMLKYVAPDFSPASRSSVDRRLARIDRKRLRGGGTLL